MSNKIHDPVADRIAAIEDQIRELRIVVRGILALMGRDNPAEIDDALHRASGERALAEQRSARAESDFRQAMRPSAEDRS